MKIIGSSVLSLSIDSTSGVVTGLTRKAGNDNLIKVPSEHGPVLLFAVNSNEERIPLYPDSPENLGSFDSASKNALGCTIGSFRDSVGRSYPIQATWSALLAQDSEDINWQIIISNQSQDLTIVEVLFPYLRGIYLGQTHSDDIIVFPHHAGELTVNPIEEYASQRYLSFGRGQSVKTAAGYSREINYCGLASMLWLDYFDPQGGLYFASHDPEFLLTGLLTETGWPHDPWLNLAFRKYVPIRSGESWSSAPYMTSVHKGDWHWGAKRYRQWFDTVVTVPEIPPTLREEHALCPRYDFRYGGTLAHRFSEIPAMYEAARAEGITHFFISGWNRGGFDTYYPEFLPDFELGTSLQLADGCRYIREHGGMVTFYINVRLFDLESEYFPTTGIRWSIKDYRNTHTTETYGPRSFSVLCPANPEVRKWYADTAVWMVAAFGAQGIYLDQLGSATPLPCYDHDHDHGVPQHHGLYNQGYLALLTDVATRTQEYNPKAFLMIENCGDIYGSQVFANLTWNGEFYDEFFTLYKYTFPEYLQVNMVNPRRISDKAERNRWFYRDVARAFLLGSIFWAELGDRFGDDDADLREYLRKVLKLRKAAAPYFAAGRFVDNEGLTVATSSVQATHWLGADFELIALANPEMVTDAQVTVLTDLDKDPVTQVYGLSKAPALVECKNSAGRLNLPVDAAPLSFVLIPRR